jgi:hypothetical protein
MDLKVGGMLRQCAAKALPNMSLQDDYKGRTWIL